MKYIVKSILMLSLFAALTALAGQRISVDQSRHASCPTIHAMVADGDIGDGTSPSRKG
ncbi:MAG TPA: hypothetical protein VGM51_16675 [Armatimonadota bacterium]|jgi:hypothetical protein